MKGVSALSFVAALIALCKKALSFSNVHIANECECLPARPRSVHHSRWRLSASAEGSERAEGNRLLIFGLGNVGTLVARRGTTLLDPSASDAPYFHQVCGTTRSGKEMSGIEAIGFDDSGKLEDILPSCTHILATIPPMDPSSPGNGRNATDLCDPVLNHPTISLKDLLPASAWVGYISSTSGYGNHDGEWVDESSEVRCQPGSKGELYCNAENEWREAAKACGWRMHVFRSAGLYGDNRSALHTIRKRGIREETKKESASNKDSPTSRIHEEDVSRAILSAMMLKEPSAGESCLWNIADDEPAPRAEVMAFGAQLLSEFNLLPAIGERQEKKDG
ncbi:hypothetical protein ACHAXT_007059 [Thalassiosira profunda]